MTTPVGSQSGIHWAGMRAVSLVGVVWVRSWCARVDPCKIVTSLGAIFLLGFPGEVCVHRVWSFRNEEAMHGCVWDSHQLIPDRLVASNQVVEGQVSVGPYSQRRREWEC